MTANLKKLSESLHPLERRVLPVLATQNELGGIAQASGLKEVEVMRALQWLANKGLVMLASEPKEIVLLDKNGQLYLKKGLPERRFLEALRQKELPLQKIPEKTGLSKEEVNISLGLLRAKAAVMLLKDKALSVKLTSQGKELLEKELLEERFLKLPFPVELASLSGDERHAFEQLRKRKAIIKIDIVKTKRAQLTELGQKLLSFGVRDENIVDAITPELLRTAGWRGKTFRRFDVKINVPKIFAGKKQPYAAFLDWVRQKFLSLGFTEMSGPIVETDFWNMDALYMPQFHSAREIHEAYYITKPKMGKLDESLVKKVKEVHENGGKTGSTGWRYTFDVQRTHRLLLRTQGTACSARMLGSKELKIPGKYFGIARCFRPDVVDATHLADFNQTEGIVVEEGLTFRHLKWLLELFAREFTGAEEARIVPGYFPFTEPSAELFAKHPELGWVELGGAGIFRPEVVIPLLGRRVPVLAWGLGIDRIAMFKLGIKDIRQLFSQDLGWLREAKVI